MQFFWRNSPVRLSNMFEHEGPELIFIILGSYQWSHHPSVGLCLSWNSVLFEISSQAFTFECSRASSGVVQDLHLCRLHLSVPLPQGKPGRAATGRDAVQGGEEMMKGNFLKFHICKGHAFGLHLPLPLKPTKMFLSVFGFTCHCHALLLTWLYSLARHVHSLC